MKRPSPRTERRPSRKRSKKQRRRCHDRRSQVAKEQFSGGPMTAHGGAGLWRRFVSKLRLPQRLAQLSGGRRGRRFSVADYLLSMVYGLLLGRLRQVEVAELRHDPGALKALGLDTVPSQSSLSRFLAACDEGLAQQVLQLNRQLVRQLHPHVGTATIDLDGQVIVARGDPEGANYGYNPNRRGSKSYFAMMGFWGETRDALDAALLAGSQATVSAQGAIELYRRSREGLPERVRRVRLRADEGFYSNDFLSQLESDGVLYFVPGAKTPPVERKIARVKFRQLDQKWALGEFWYTGHKFPHPRRFVVIRERLDPENPRDRKQLEQLELLKVPAYVYQVIVTNASWSPEDVWHFYNHRSCMENMIKESQYDFGSDHVLSKRYAGNLLWLSLSVLAYNVTNWFRGRILRQHAHRETARTLRRKLIDLPARLVRSGGRYGLKFWEHHPSRQLYEKVLLRLEAFAS